MDFDLYPNFHNWVADAGFVDIEDVERVVPIGTWPKDRRLKQRGRYFVVQVLDLALDSYTPALFTRGGWSEEDMRALLDGMKREIRSNKLHIYTHLFVHIFLALFSKNLVETLV